MTLEIDSLNEFKYCCKNNTSKCNKIMRCDSMCVMSMLLK